MSVEAEAALPHEGTNSQFVWLVSMGITWDEAGRTLPQTRLSVHME